MNNFALQNNVVGFLNILMRQNMDLIIKKGKAQQETAIMKLKLKVMGEKPHNISLAASTENQDWI